MLIGVMTVVMLRSWLLAAVAVVAVGFGMEAMATGHPAQVTPPAGNLFVRAVADASTRALPGWTIVASGTGGEADGFEASLVTDERGVAGFGAVPAGIYTICASGPGGQAASGSTINGAAEMAGACRPEVEVGEGDAVIDFFAARSDGATPTPTSTPSTNLFPMPTRTTTLPVATPTPVDAVAGERTPGNAARPTPVAPETGSGQSGDGGGAAWLVVGALGVAGAALIAGRSRRTGG